jgi:hypothetical protein
VLDESVKHKWSDPTVLPAVIFIINNTVSLESGVVPFHAHFGNPSATYFKIPEDLDPQQKTKQYLVLLDNNLKLISKLSKQHQDKEAAERSKGSTPETQNKYQEGDYVFFQYSPDVPRKHKLLPRYKGPFKVRRQYSNNVECQCLIQGSIHTFHVSELKIFHCDGTETECAERAFRLATKDDDQYVIVAFKAFRGNVEKRTTLEFEIEFADGDIKWLPWSNDIFNTIQFEEYCTRNRMLMYHKLKVPEAKALIRQLDREPILEVDVGTKVYVCLRQYGSAWYEELKLPDFEHIDYVMEGVYGPWKDERTKLKIQIELLVTNEAYDVSNSWIMQFGSVRNFDPERMVLVDMKFIVYHPEILSERTRQTTLKRFKRDLGL